SGDGSPRRNSWRNSSSRGGKTAPASTRARPISPASSIVSTVWASSRMAADRTALSCAVSSKWCMSSSCRAEDGDEAELGGVLLARRVAQAELAEVRQHLGERDLGRGHAHRDRKSTRLNS